MNQINTCTDGVDGLASFYRKFTAAETTMFESITSEEPMEDFHQEVNGLGSITEESDATDPQSSSSVQASDDRKEQRHQDSMLKKKKRTSFAQHTEVHNFTTDKDAAKTPGHGIEYMDSSMEVDGDLADQFENVSVSTLSELSETNELARDVSDVDSGLIEDDARLEQICTRIFVTILPEDESAEQRHCDLVQAQRRLAELTNNAQVLVVNCGQPALQLMTIFNQIQNCPFDLEGCPDLATFVAFCERVHDWLMVTTDHVLLLHAEGHSARIRLLLLIRALSTYYESEERHETDTSHALRQYIVKYTNGQICTPVSWLRYSAYMRLFSPENCLHILRATFGIYRLFLYNFPVFEENTLRLFIKLYSGTPLRPVYTTLIHNFHGSETPNLNLLFTNLSDGNSKNCGLRLQGNIMMIAYHCRPYPSKRLRLFRLHFHSCQTFLDRLNFHKADFDEISDAFPSSMRLELYCTNHSTLTHKVPIDVREERVDSPPHNTIPPFSLKQSDGTMNPDEASRLQDSLENLCQLPRGRYTHFQSMDALSYLPMSSDEYSTSHAPSSDGPALPQRSIIQRAVDTHQIQTLNSTSSIQTTNTTVSKSVERPNSSSQSPHLNTNQLMPPPTEIPKQTHKRQRSIRKHFSKIFGGRCKLEDHYSFDTISESGDELSSITNESIASCESHSNNSLSAFVLHQLRKLPSIKRKSKGEHPLPSKTRKVTITNEMNECIIASVPSHSYTEDLIEAARRLNFMAGTQELDRLLEELRMTSMQMSSGLPPTSPKSYTTLQTGHAPSSTLSPAVQHGHGPPGRNTYGGFSRTFNTSSLTNTNLSSGSTYHQKLFSSSSPSAYRTERRLDAHNRSNQYPVYRSTQFPSASSSTVAGPWQKHQATYTTTLQQRQTSIPRQLSQVHLTIDPDCGNGELNSSFKMSSRDISEREHKLESELNSARQELAHLRRAMSLIEERQRNGFSQQDLSLPTSPTMGPTQMRSPSTIRQFYTNSSNNYQSQHGFRSSSTTFQRSSAQQEAPYRVTGTTGPSAYPLNKRAVSHTNLQGTRSWNLRSQKLQGSETDLTYRRINSTTNSPLIRPGYSAHRERLKYEREQDLLRQQRQLTMAGSSTGLNEPYMLNRSKHQYRSMSAMNTGTIEERIDIEPIGRGVHDLDNGATMIQRGHGGGSMMDGLHHTDKGQRTPLQRRGFSSTQYLNRNPSNSEIFRQTPIHQPHTVIDSARTPQPIQRFDTNGTLASTSQFNGNRSQASTGSATIVAPPPTTSQPASWRTEVVGQTRVAENGSYTADAGLRQVQETASIWYRPNVSRGKAISMLRDQVPGSFLIRDSTTFKEAFGLAVKVAKLPPKVTPKSDDLQSELVRHYLIEVVTKPNHGVHLKGFSTEPVFDSLAQLIHRHTTDPLALPCRLILPPMNSANSSANLISAFPRLVIGRLDQSAGGGAQVHTSMSSTHINDVVAMDNNTVCSSNSAFNRASSEFDSIHTDTNELTEGAIQIPVHVNTPRTTTPQNVPYVCVLRESPTSQLKSPAEVQLSQGMTFRCLMLGSVDTPQWSTDMCFSRSVDQLIPLAQLTAAECDHGMSRVRYTEVQLHISAHDGITIIDLQRLLFLRRHLPNHILLYCGVETRKKEFHHPEQQLHSIINPKIFGIVVRKGISECTTHIFSECDPNQSAESIVSYIRSTYPHLNVNA